jgi:stage V sporulation protein B
MAETKGKVVKQAAFLMTAQMISSVIGLLYRSPLHSLMGDLGDGYYQFAYEWYTIILLIASYSIPSAVSKVMAERLAVHAYKNAQKVFKAALFYVAAALVFFLDHRLGKDARLSAPRQQTLGRLALVILGLLFVLLTFYPPHFPLWQDPLTGRYGVRG